MEKAKQRRGFACMTPEQRRAIASKGGKAAQGPGGLGHKFTREEARAAGMKGGHAPHPNGRGRGVKHA